MKITKKLQETVIKEVAGEDTLVIVNYLRGKKNISEFIIADELEIEIHSIRNMLYRLLDANLVTFTRKKDKQKGWYIYYWTYDPNNIGHLYWEIKKKRLENLQDRLRRETTSHFFICPQNCLRLEFEKAIQFDYRCPECGDMLAQEDNSKKIKEFEAEIKELEQEIKKR